MRSPLVLFSILCMASLCCGQGTPSGFSLSSWATETLSAASDSTTLIMDARAFEKEAARDNNTVLMARAQAQLGMIYAHYDAIDSAIIRLESAKAFYLHTERYIELAEVYLELDRLYKYTADYSESMKQDFAALEIYEDLNDQGGIARCYTNICDLMYYEDHYQEGIDYCNKAIAIQKGLDDTNGLALSYRFRADNELQLNQLDQALTSTDMAIAILRKEGMSDHDLRGYFNTRGNVLKFMKRYEEALSEYTKNYELTKTFSASESELVATLGNIGHLYVLQEEYEKAIPYCLEAIEIIKRSGNTQNLWENYMHLSNAYQATGDFQNALHYSNLYGVEHALYQRNTIDNLEAELKVKYETEKKDETIQGQSTIIAQQQKIQYLFIGIGSLLAVILFGLIYFNRKRKLRNEQLAIVNLELDKKNALNELLLKEIHHRVKNNLAIVQSLISLQSAKMDESAGKEAMIASKNRVQSMSIIHQRLYQGENLGAIEMRDYFVNLGDALLDAYNAHEKVNIDYAMEKLELDVDTAIPIGLIVNELLTNAMKYAFPNDRKGKISIHLEQAENDSLKLKVSDNGVGKVEPVQGDGSGFGTQLVRLLTKQLKGTYEENSVDGMTVTFRLKMRKAA